MAAGQKMGTVILSIPVCVTTDAAVAEAAGARVRAHVNARQGQPDLQALRGPSALQAQAAVSRARPAHLAPLAHPVQPVQAAPLLLLVVCRPMRSYPIRRIILFL